MSRFAAGSCFLAMIGYSPIEAGKEKGLVAAVRLPDSELAADETPAALLRKDITGFSSVLE